MDSAPLSPCDALMGWDESQQDGISHNGKGVINLDELPSENILMVSSSWKEQGTNKTFNDEHTHVVAFLASLEKSPGIRWWLGNWAPPSPTPSASFHRPCSQQGSKAGAIQGNSQVGKSLVRLG